MKVPVLDTDDFVLYIEEVDDNSFIHCDVVAKWNKTVKRNLQIAFNLLTQEYGKELYALHAPEDKKHEKFLKMFNFSYLQSLTGKDGKDYDIYIWR
jgi:hypothetical protein